MFNLFSPQSYLAYLYRFKVFIKIGFLISVLVFSCSALSWTCSDHGGEGRNSIEYHYSVASDILFGVVVGGTYDDDRDNSIEFTLKILESFKGHKVGDVILKTDPGGYFEDIVLGESYLFTLYGNNTIDLCGYNYRLGRNVNNVERLRNIAKSENAILHETIERFFEFVDYPR